MASSMDCCRELMDFLEKVHEKKKLSNEEFLNFAIIVDQRDRQCKCLLRNPNFIFPFELVIKEFYIYIAGYTKNLSIIDKWSVDEANKTEKLFSAVCKTLQLQYPLYQAYESVKNNFEVSEKQRELMAKYCDVSETTNTSELLLENIADFCEKGGIEAIQSCFAVENNLIPLNVACQMIHIVGQIRGWLHEEAINSLVKPLGSFVSKYICQMKEDDLRLVSARATAEVMLNTVKVTDIENICIDLDILNVAFKYFLSSTLAVRMAGLNLISNQIHHLIEMEQNHLLGDIDNICIDLASWLNEKEMVELLFGPNYHVELVKQSQFLLNFLAQERHLMPKHLDCIWAAAQLKHISRFVLDILIGLAKTMDLPSVQYLLKLISKMPVTSHTKQTLLLSSLLTRNIWSAGIVQESPDMKLNRKISPKKISFTNKPTHFKEMQMSPMQSPILSSEGSTDDEMADIHARHFSISQNEQMEQLKSLDLKINESQIRALTKAPYICISPSPRQMSNIDMESCVLGSQDSTINTEGDDTVSCTNTNGSSLSDSEKDITEDLEDVQFASPMNTPIKKESEVQCIDFDVEKICDPGTTMLWDIIQDQSLEARHIVDEAQKILWQLICYSGDKKVRMAFIKGCLDNIKNNKSVIVSFKILPKILTVFPHSSNSTEASKLFVWAVKELDLMGVFFSNLIEFSTNLQNVDDSNQSDDFTIEQEQQIQARLDFLAAMFSDEISPDHFRLSISQIDALWTCLVVNIPEHYHFLVLTWLLKQSNSEDLHALGLDSFKHIFINKLPDLNVEKMTLTGLQLFQKLFGLTQLSNASPFTQQDTESEEFVLGVAQLWKIAFGAEKLQVSNEAINLLTHLYLSVGETSMEKIGDFIEKCMTVISDALKNLDQNCLQSLKMFQQVVKIMLYLIDIFSKRFSYHIELWRLNGRNIASHQRVNKSNKDNVLKIICQPNGATEKVVFRMMQSDLLAKFRARVTHWCMNLQEAANEKDNIFLKPPFRLITHGHELTADLDLKTLGDIGMKNQQLVFISVGSVRKDRVSLSQVPPSLLPEPNFEALPMIRLLKEDCFNQLFNLLEVLYRVSLSEDYQTLWLAVLENKNEMSNSFESGDIQEYVKPMSADEILCKVWELILTLPTNGELKSQYTTLDFDENTDWKLELSFDKRFKLLYVLQVLDSISLPIMKVSQQNNDVDASSESDSSLSDTDKENSTQMQFASTWIPKLFKTGFVQHILVLLSSEELDPKTELDEWSLNCLAYIMKILTRVGLVSLPSQFKSSKPSSSAVIEKKYVFRSRYKSAEKENAVVINQFNTLLVEELSKQKIMEILIPILSYTSDCANKNINITVQDVRASVVYHCISFLICWVSSDMKLCGVLLNHKEFSELLIQLVFFSSLKSVRLEATRGFYKLCLSAGQNVLCKILNLLLSKLQELVSLRSELKLQSFEKIQQQQQLERPVVMSSSSNYKDYFWLVCRLINRYNHIEAKEKIDVRTAILQVSQFIQDSEEFEIVGAESYTFVDYCLIGLIHMCAALLQHDYDFKTSTESFNLLNNIFYKCLFALPTPTCDNERPKCETKLARQGAFDLLLQLSTNCKEIFMELQRLLMKHHYMHPTSKVHPSYGWNYWPHEQERSAVGYVGLINLGATCYMASCVQQLFMIPLARSAILQTPITKDTKHQPILKEVQKMFGNLQCSLRKAYNPRSFCKTYTMDKQPLNTGEQKDMTEFFTDFISKLEEMGPNLKETMRELFCGVITNNVISLDCSHVSKTEEEFYSVRCTVADMKTLYESLDEVTVKDVLEGDNKYTCSQCNDKVRAEKRACFKTLPKIMCFNTMRYTFNMVTMMKEKVNTHFSFPMKLNMAGYTEEYLLKEKRGADPDENTEHWYYLAGVVVHTGTADGGHYYSFIRDRTSKENMWYLFNDAEVKNFDPSQIAAECFGGEMTTKTFDTMTEKYMDFSFEKTHSAYMLFYEHSRMDEESKDFPPVSIPRDLQDQIWEDNHQFFLDKLIFDYSYFNFLWQFCNLVPKSLSEDVYFHSTKLAVSFLLETLVHSKEKYQMKSWIELIMFGFEKSPLVCEWFLDSMSYDDWWIQQLLVRCPTQHLRQVFCQICLVAIKILRPNQVQDYEKEFEEENLSEDEEKDIEACTPITRFIKNFLALLEDNLKLFCKHLTDYFHFLYQFLSLGHEECSYLLQLDAISSIVNFYNSLKAAENSSDTSCDDQDDVELEDDEVLSMFPEDKFYPASLEKMVGSIALLLEEARDGQQLRLSEADFQCIVGKQDFPFLIQVTGDGINLRQVSHIIFHLSRHDEKMADAIVVAILTAAQKLAMEPAQPFFKLLTFLTDVGENGLPGLPSFGNIILPKILKTADSNTALCLDWLSTQVSRSMQAHKVVLESMDKWLEKYLIADQSPRIRGGAAFLLISLIPNQHFLVAYRSRMFSSNQKELKLNADAKSILHKIYLFLLNLLGDLKKYCGKNHLGTTRLTNYFTVLNFFTISDEEKALFTPFSEDLWKLYHPTISETDVEVHFNKQSLLSFWFHVCEGFPDNIKFITDNDHVASNIAFNYILSNDEQDVIAYNNSTLPVYYGLMRLACMHSKEFCKTLSMHSNITWAFEHLIPRANHYPQAVDELLQLMKLFAGERYENEDDAKHASKFRQKNIELFCGCIDTRHSWNTFVTILKILMEDEEDCLCIATSNGLNQLAEALSAVFQMSQEATACNVDQDIMDIVNLLNTVLDYCYSIRTKSTDIAKALNGWTSRNETIVHALSLLNSFVPTDIHKVCLELLTVLLQLYPEDCIEAIVHHIHQSHMAIRMTQSLPQVGPYFPKYQGNNLTSSMMSKHTVHNSRKLKLPRNHELNMALHPTMIDSAIGDDTKYESDLYEYFDGYHHYVDKVCRYGLNFDEVPEILIEISCMLAVEVLPLKFDYFVNLWLEVWNKSSDNPKYRKCIQKLFLSESFIEFLDTLFSDERILLDNQSFYTFVCQFLPKVHHRVLQDQQKENVLALIFQSLVEDAQSLDSLSDQQFEKACPRLNGDLRALCLLLSVSNQNEMKIPSVMEDCVQIILKRYEKYTENYQKFTTNELESTVGVKLEEEKTEENIETTEQAGSSLPQDEKSSTSKNEEDFEQPPRKKVKSEDEAEKDDKTEKDTTDDKTLQSSDSDSQSEAESSDNEATTSKQMPSKSDTIFKKKTTGAKAQHIKRACMSLMGILVKTKSTDHSGSSSNDS